MKMKCCHDHGGIITVNEYEPPKGTGVIGAVAALFLVMGLAFIALVFVEIALIALPVSFIIVGALMLLLYLDLKNPNGKLSLKEIYPYSYTIVLRKKTAPADNTREQNTNGQYSSDVPPEYSTKNRKRRKNTTGVYTYMNCPYCGSLNEVGHVRCRSCGKKL